MITSKNDIAPNLATELAIYQHLLYKRQAVKMTEPVVDMSEPVCIVWYVLYGMYCMVLYGIGGNISALFTYLG